MVSENPTLRQKNQANTSLNIVEEYFKGHQYTIPRSLATEDENKVFLFTQIKKFIWFDAGSIRCSKIKKSRRFAYLLLR